MNTNLIKLIIPAILAFSTSALADLKYECDSPTDNHPALSFTINKQAQTSKITVEENDGTSTVFSAAVAKSIAAQFGRSLLKEPIVMIGLSNDSFIGGERSFYTSAMSLVVMQRQPGLTGAMTAYLTLDNTVTVHTCSVAK